MLIEDMNFIRNITEDELHFRNFNENHFNITENSSYVIVTTGIGQTVVRKSSIVWLFSKTTNNLSSDRLVRVKDMQIKKRDNIKTLQMNVDVMDDVSVGDWSVFKDSNVFLIGLVLSFKYLTGGKKQYSREFAPVRYSKDDGNERGTGVMAKYYVFNENSSVCQAENLQKQINIEQYKATISRPT